MSTRAASRVEDPFYTVTASCGPAVASTVISVPVPWDPAATLGQIYGPDDDLMFGVYWLAQPGRTYTASVRELPDGEPVELTVTGNVYATGGGLDAGRDYTFTLTDDASGVAQEFTFTARASTEDLLTLGSVYRQGGNMQAEPYWVPEAPDDTYTASYRLWPDGPDAPATVRDRCWTILTPLVEGGVYQGRVTNTATGSDHTITFPVQPPSRPGFALTGVRVATTETAAAIAFDPVAGADLYVARTSPFDGGRAVDVTSRDPQTLLVPDLTPGGIVLTMVAGLARDHNASWNIMLMIHSGVQTAPPLPAPDHLNVTVATLQRIEITFDPVVGATGYRAVLYRDDDHTPTTGVVTGTTAVFVGNFDHITYAEIVAVDDTGTGADSAGQAVRMAAMSADEAENLRNVFPQPDGRAPVGPDGFA